MVGRTREYNLSRLVDSFCSRSNLALKGWTVGLTGELGSGKTHLVREILGGFEESGDHLVSSPTFGICHQYELPSLQVDHFDLYRIESADELYQMQIWELLEENNHLIFIEWADLFPEVMSFCNEVIHIQACEDGSRTYCVTVR